MPALLYRQRPIMVPSVLVETTKSFYIPLALVALYATPERMHWKVVGNLGKNKLSCIHA
jgi:hypothetical protein